MKIGVESFIGEVKEEVKDIRSRMPRFFDELKSPTQKEQESDANNNGDDSKGNSESLTEKKEYPEGSMLEVYNKSKETKDNSNESDLSEQSKETKSRELTVEEKQEAADKAAQEYNKKYRPYERAVEKGIEGVKQTENGGVSFEDTDDIYTKDDGTKCVVSIEATGNRSDDFDAANKAMGLDETPDGYVWHHRDDYNAKYGTVTLELVKTETHNATKPHSGGCAMYDAANGPTYNPPKQGG